MSSVALLRIQEGAKKFSGKQEAISKREKFMFGYLVRFCKMCQAKYFSLLSHIFIIIAITYKYHYFLPF